MADSKLIVALDVSNLREAERWVDALRPHVTLFKVGSTLFTAVGPQVVEMIHQKKKDVFLDLKFHDIPNTVSDSCRVVARLGVLMMNLHIVGGNKVLKGAVAAVTEESSKIKSRKPILLGVTLLTHLDKDALSHFGWDLTGEMKEEVIRLRYPSSNSTAPSDQARPMPRAASTRMAWVRQRNTSSVSRLTPTTATIAVFQVSSRTVSISSTTSAGCPVKAT